MDFIGLYCDVGIGRGAEEPLPIVDRLVLFYLGATRKGKVVIIV